MMLRSLLLLLPLLGLVLPCMAQDAAPGTTDPLLVTKRKAAFRTLFNFDARRTFVNAEPVRFYGFRLGAQRGKDVVSIGFYGLGDAYVREAVELEGIGTRDLRTNFDYVGLGFERLLVDARRWQVGVPLSLGLGNYRTSYLDNDDITRTWTVNELVPVEASLHVDYNVFWWAFIGVGGGYRYVLASERDVTVSLSDWTYFLKVGLRFGEIVKRARKELLKNDGA